jgi:iron complex transport system substrate-binding protein
VGQQPDLVLAVPATPADVVSGLEALQIPVLLLNPPTIDGVLANIRLVGRATGAVAAAERLAAQMQQRWSGVAERARAAQSKPRVFYELDGTNPASVYTAGAGTFIDAMITTAGGVNAVAQAAPGVQYPQMNSEAVLQLNPQLILLGDAPFGQSYETLTTRPGWNAVEAVQKRAVVGLAHGLEMELVAEGIEKVEEMQMLKALTCEYGQGYHFSRPVPGDDALGLVAKGTL